MSSFIPGGVYGLQKAKVLRRTPMTVTVMAMGIQTLLIHKEGTEEVIIFRGETIRAKENDDV